MPCLIQRNVLAHRNLVGEYDRCQYCILAVAVLPVRSKVKY